MVAQDNEDLECITRRNEAWSKNEENWIGVYRSGGTVAFLGRGTDYANVEIKNVANGTLVTTVKNTFLRKKTCYSN